MKRQHILKDNCHFVSEFALRDMIRGMLLRMRLAVTVLAGKSAILFSALQTERLQHTRVKKTSFDKDSRHFSFSPAGGGTCGAAYSCACAWQLQYSQENPPFCCLVLFEKDKRHFFSFSPAGGGTCSAAYSCACAWQFQYSLTGKSAIFVVWSSPGV